jgi:hypothetical protein
MNLPSNLEKNSVLTDEQEKINKLSLCSPKIISLSKSDLRKHCAALLIRIQVITGWNLPSGDILNVLNDQFQKKLIEDYPTFNVDEIEYAFRHSGTSVKDWGKEMNLSLIDGVLWPYELKRREIGRLLERMQPPPEKKPYDPLEVLNQYRYDIETAFQALKKGYRPIIHIYFEETLREDGLLSEGENVHEFFVRKLGNNSEHIYVKE